MAFMDQIKKAKIAAALKKVMPNDWKYSLAVRHHSRIVLTIKQAPVDLIGIINAKNKAYAEKWGEDFRECSDYVQLSPYHLERNYEGDVLKVLEAAKAALYSADYYDHSDAQTDYFNCAYYVDMNIGKWDKPFVCSAKAKGEPDNGNKFARFMEQVLSPVAMLDE